jgi:hypothetical protein
MSRSTAGGREAGGMRRIRRGNDETVNRSRAVRQMPFLPPRPGDAGTRSGEGKLAIRISMIETNSSAKTPEPRLIRQAEFALGVFGRGT